MTEFKTTDVPTDQPRSASFEVLTQAAMTNETLIQRLEDELTILTAHSERTISELKSELFAASAAYKELSAKIGIPAPASSCKGHLCCLTTSRRRSQVVATTQDWWSCRRNRL